MPAQPARGVLSADTSADVEARQVRLWQGMSSVDRLALVNDASRAARTLALAGLRERHPDASDRDLVARLAPDHARRHARTAGVPRVRTPRAVTELLEVASRVVTALEACEIPYTAGGSLASSVSGEPRASIDADIVVDMNPLQALALVDALGGEFYADAGALQRAAVEQSAVNLIHQPSSIKVHRGHGARGGKT